jgi:hypothetical protein
MSMLNVLGGFWGFAEVANSIHSHQRGTERFELVVKADVDAPVSDLYRVTAGVPIHVREHLRTHTHLLPRIE